MQFIKPQRLIFLQNRFYAIQIDKSEIKNQIAKKQLIIDVREPKETIEGVIPTGTTA
jgi:rhodanese-related sulfurtransferase